MRHLWASEVAGEKEGTSFVLSLISSDQGKYSMAQHCAKYKPVICKLQSRKVETLQESFCVRKFTLEAIVQVA